MESLKKKIKLSIPTVDIRIKEWEKVPKKISLKNRDVKVFDIDIEKNCICRPNWSGGIKNCPNIEVVKRIGSASQDAEIYELKINNISVAGKVIPITSDKEFIQFNNELIIANICSKAVKEGKTSSFPIVYLSTECTKTLLNKDSKFLTPLLNYNKTKFIINSVKESVVYNQLSKVDKKKWEVKIANTPNIDELLIAANNNFKLKLNFPEDLPSPSFIMISELMWGDFGQFIKQNHKIITLEIWNSLILNIFKALDYLHNSLNILHGDFHVGNILMMFDGEEWSVIIHDFGGSSQISEWMTFRKHDYLDLCESLENMEKKKEKEEENMEEKEENIKNLINHRILEKLLEVKKIANNYVESSDIKLEKKLIEYWEKN